MILKTPEGRARAEMPTIPAPPVASSRRSRNVMVGNRSEAKLSERFARPCIGADCGFENISRQFRGFAAAPTSYFARNESQCLSKVLLAQLPDSRLEA